MTYDGNYTPLVYVMMMMMKWCRVSMRSRSENDVNEISLGVIFRVLGTQLTPGKTQT